MNFNIMNKKLISLSIFISLGLIIYSLISIYKLSPSSTYEVSIYRAIPFQYWGILLLSMLLGALIILADISYNLEKKFARFLGIFLMIYVYIFILSLPIVRGYFLYGRWDPFSHFIKSQALVSTGFISTTNFYPILHIYASELHIVSDIDMNIIVIYFPFIFSIFLPMSMYLFARSILEDSDKALLVLILSSTFLQGWFINFTPNHLSNLLLPLVFYILVKSFFGDTSTTIGFRIIFIIMIFLYAPFHAVPVISIFLYLSGIFVYNLFDRSNNNNIQIFSILLLSCLFISWISSFFVWNSTITNLYTLFNEGGPTAFKMLQDKIEFGHSIGYNAWELGLKLYSGIFILILLALISVYITYKGLANSNLKIKYLSIVFILHFIIFILLFSLLLRFTPLRLIIYITIIAMVLASLSLDYFIKISRSFSGTNKSAIVLAIFIVFIFLFANGISILYPSPYVLSFNDQLTENEFLGLNWFKAHSYNETTVLSISLTSTIKRTFEERYRQLSILKKAMPPHFNYNKTNSLGYSLDKDNYMILNGLDKLIFIESAPKAAASMWNKDDFNHLNDDVSINKLFESGLLNIWYVNKI